MLACQRHATPQPSVSDDRRAIGSDTLGSHGKRNIDPEGVGQSVQLVALLQSAEARGPLTRGGAAAPLTPGCGVACQRHAEQVVFTESRCVTALCPIQIVGVAESA